MNGQMEEVKNVLTVEKEENIFTLMTGAHEYKFLPNASKFEQSNFSIFFSCVARRIIYITQVVLPSKNLPYNEILVVKIDLNSFQFSALIMRCNPSGAESEALMDSETAKLLDSVTFDRIQNVMARLQILFDFCTNAKLTQDYHDALDVLNALILEARKENRIREYVESLTKTPIKHGKGHTLWKVERLRQIDTIGLEPEQGRPSRSVKYPFCRAPHLKTKETAQ